MTCSSMCHCLQPCSSSRSICFLWWPGYHSSILLALLLFLISFHESFFPASYYRRTLPVFFLYILFLEELLLNFKFYKESVSVTSQPFTLWITSQNIQMTSHWFNLEVQQMCHILAIPKQVNFPSGTCSTLILNHRSQRPPHSSRFSSPHLVPFFSHKSKTNLLTHHIGCVFWNLCRIKPFFPPPPPPLLLSHYFLCYRNNSLTSFSTLFPVQPVQYSSQSDLTF